MCNSESKLYDIDTVLMQHHSCVRVEVQLLLSLSTTTLEFRCHHSGVRVSLLVSLSNITDMVIASRLYWSNLTMPMLKRVLILFIDKLLAAWYRLHETTYTLS